MVNLILYHGLLNGSGMNYSRYNKSLLGKEYIAFAGFGGAWTNQP
jgi:hypothetical protein